MHVMDLTDAYVEEGFDLPRAIALAVQDSRQTDLDILADPYDWEE